MTVEQIVGRVREILEKKMVYILPPEQMSEEVMYVSREAMKWFDSIMAVLYQEEVKSNEIVHVLNLKKCLEEFPKQVEEFRKNAPTFFGLCKAGDILRDESKIAGITHSKVLLLPVENQLLGINAPMLTNCNFKPTMNKEELKTPLDDIYRSMGIPQYFEEIEKKKFLEKLLSKEKLNYDV